MGRAVPAEIKQTPTPGSVQSQRGAWALPSLPHGTEPTSDYLMLLIKS